MSYATENLINFFFLIVFFSNSVFWGKELLIIYLKNCLSIKVLITQFLIIPKYHLILFHTCAVLKESAVEVMAVQIPSSGSLCLPLYIYIYRHRLINLILPAVTEFKTQQMETNAHTHFTGMHVRDILCLKF